MLVSDAETPFLLLDVDNFEGNLACLSTMATAAGIKVRPHAKTHKSSVIAQKQMKYGAIGVCVQKVAEAEALAWGGVTDILVTNQIIAPDKIARLAALSSVADVALCVDDIRQVDVIESVAATMSIRMNLFIEVDVGGGRCGVNTGEAAIELASRIAKSKHLKFGGIQAYNGKAQHIACYERREEQASRGAEKCSDMLDAMTRVGIECRTVSGGGTGTFEFDIESGVYTEIQPGSYCFMDADYTKNRDRTGATSSLFQQSLFVVSSVISTPRHGVVVLDAGHKSIAIDRGFPVALGRPDFEIVSVSDEHTRIAVREATSSANIGERIKLVPGHCDPTVDRFDWYVCARGERVVSLWPVSARGAVY
ncbi:DSD1 family PLP-dependent enzyme [Pseudochrobactrum sp. Wa41.01b-1]|uniref:DSD1 family PLP-dependent enzyme n=1 Tax=Pseudochrobactrum sp. Wa41.01b-1 TaxID=2864102 RepID=UPI002105A632|nr:DSD1 family PLP-dependent enzyme [Pseudochrobactrum sp. Wa41.01b-1]